MISADLGSPQFEERGVRVGVRFIEERKTRLAGLDASIARSIADIEAGRTKAIDEAFDRLEAKYAVMNRAPQ